MKSTEITAVIAAATLMVTGTYAWQSFNQEIVNEVYLVPPEVGGRLHDDFDGTNKDVYVENYGSIENDDENVYARIRIDEYMEIGSGAGVTTADRTDVTVVRGDKQKQSATPSLTDMDTWDTYLYKPATESNIRQYHDLKLGGNTVYMPTFNKNKDSLAGEVNGTVTGSDGDKYDFDDAYDDYVNYSAGQSITANAVYDFDDDSDDEGSGSMLDVDHIEVEETHTAKSTLNATVVSMESWLSGGCRSGAFWVYDVDGWAYWAQPITPQTATGLLIDEILTISKPAEVWYYGVNVICQIASGGDWGDASDTDPSSSMHASDMTENGLYVLNKAAGLVRFSGLGIVDEDKSSATILFDSIDGDFNFGDSHDYGLSEYTVINGNDNDSDTHKFTWSVEDSLGTAITGVITSDGIFTPGDRMRGVYTITVTSVLDPSKSASITVEIKGLNIFGLTPVETELREGSDISVTVDGIEFYLLDLDTVDEYDESGNIIGSYEAAWIWSVDSLSSDVYHSSSSSWEGSNLRKTILPAWLQTKSELSNAAIRVKLITDGYYSQTSLVPTNTFSAETTYDQVYVLSKLEFHNYVGLNTVRAEYKGVTTASGYRLRSPVSADGASGVMSNGTLYFVGGSVSNSQGTRPALWVELYPQ